MLFITYLLLISYPFVGTQCQFFGVTCDPTTFSVTSIKLNNLQLSGTLPLRTFSLLTNLLTFEVSNNRLGGNPPNDLIYSGSKLTSLLMNDNLFTGPLSSSYFITNAGVTLQV